MMIQLQPDSAGAYYNRGNTYVDKGVFDNAIKDFDTAIELDTYYLNAYYNRGFAYLKKGEFDDAIKDFDMVIQLQPDSAGAYYNRGEVWLHLQAWEKAKSDIITAKDMGADIIASFHNDYANVADFEQKTGIQLPEDIAALLTSPQPWQQNRKRLPYRIT